MSNHATLSQDNLSPIDLLQQGSATMGLEFDEKQLSQFGLFLEEIVRENERFGLTAITRPKEIVTHHFLDSLAPLGLLKVPTGATLVDIGSGAGLPGIPLKIAEPGLKMFLVESTAKKTAFIRSTIQALGLQDVTVSEARIEDLGHDPAYREQFDLAVARGVGHLAVLCEYALPMLATGGLFIAYKGRRVSEELQSGQKAADILGGRVEQAIRAVIPFLEEERFIVPVKKLRTCPAKYPRRAGIPQKRPLGIMP